LGHNEVLLGPFFILFLQSREDSRSTFNAPFLLIEKRKGRGNDLESITKGHQIQSGAAPLSLLSLPLGNDEEEEESHSHSIDIPEEKRGNEALGTSEREPITHGTLNNEKRDEFIFIFIFSLPPPPPPSVLPIVNARRIRLSQIPKCLKSENPLYSARVSARVSSVRYTKIGIDLMCNEHKLVFAEERVRVYTTGYVLQDENTSLRSLGLG